MKFVIEHLSKSFEKKEVLRDIDFTFDEGKIYGLLGRRGHRICTLYPNRAGVSYRQGVFEVLYGHQREVHQKTEKH